MNAIVVNVELVEINCGGCGSTYAINERYRKDCQSKGTGWHCPYCMCSWGYHGNGTEARLEKELEIERNRLARERANHDQTKAELEHVERRRRAAVGQTTRIKQRIAGGACPCCKRSFGDLRRHMVSKHPDYAAKP